MALGDEQINRLLTGLDKILDYRLQQLQEMLNGIKITATVNVEMPVVKQASEFLK